MYFKKKPKFYIQSKNQTVKFYIDSYDIKYYDIKKDKLDSNNKKDYKDDINVYLVTKDGKIVLIQREYSFYFVYILYVLNQNIIKTNKFISNIYQEEILNNCLEAITDKEFFSLCSFCYKNKLISFIPFSNCFLVNLFENYTDSFEIKSISKDFKIGIYLKFVNYITNNSSFNKKNQFITFSCKYKKNLSVEKNVELAINPPEYDRKISYSDSINVFYEFFNNKNISIRYNSLSPKIYSIIYDKILKKTYYNHCFIISSDQTYQEISDILNERNQKSCYVQLNKYKKSLIVNDVIKQIVLLKT